MPQQCVPDSLDLGEACGRKVVGAFDGGRLTTEAGAVLLSAFRQGHRPAGSLRPLLLGRSQSDAGGCMTCAPWWVSGCSACAWATKTWSTMTSCATIPSSARSWGG